MTWSPVRTLYRRQWVPRDLHETFAFFERPENLARITPPWLGFRIMTPPPIRMTRDLTIDYTVRVFGIRTRWRSLINGYEPPHWFQDVQVIGPYRLWIHRHGFWREQRGTVIEDLVTYELPLGPLGLLMNRLVVRRQLDAIFDFRQAQIATRLAAPVSSDRA